MSNVNKGFVWIMGLQTSFYLYTSQTFFFTFSVNMLYFSDFFLHFCSEHVLISEKVSH